MRCAYFAGSLLLIGLLASEFALSSTAAKAGRRPPASTNKVSQPLPSLRGAEAVERLKEEGLYNSLAEAVAATDPLIVQQAKLTANDGAAGAAFGTAVAISGDTAVIGAPHASVAAADQGSVDVFVRSGRSWTRQARLTAVGGAASGHFGASVAVSGDLLVAGAPDENINANMGQGSAYVFARSGATWSQQQRLTDDDGAANYHIGASVAISTDTIMIGATGVDGYKGSVYIFALAGGIWSRQKNIAAPDGAARDNFGASVAIGADTIVVGAPNHNIGSNTNQGSAYVFALSGGDWSYQQTLTAPDGAARDNFGASVAIGADTIVVGAPNHSEGANYSQGSAHVFTRSGATWTHQVELTVPDGASSDAFGISVAIDADMLVIGAPGAERFKGAAYVFARDGAKWYQRQRLAGDDNAPVEFFGQSVAISGDTMLAGTPGADLGSNYDQGSAYAFVISGDFTQRQTLMAGLGRMDFFAYSVAISGDTAALGARNDAVGGIYPGSVYIFTRGDGGWSLQQKLLAPDGASGDNFGQSVAIYGNTLVVGAPNHKVGQNVAQGSAYVFTRDGMSLGPPQELTASDGAAQNNFGSSVGIYADTLVIGAPDQGGPQSSAYVFARSGADWIQRQRLTAWDGATDNDFGVSAAIYADTIVVGATGFSSPGSAYVFARESENWSQQQKLTSDDGHQFSFGCSVAISGDTVVVGAIDEDVVIGSGTLETHLGSAFIFTRDGAAWTQRQKLTAPDGEPSDFFGASVAISGGIIVVGAMLDDIGQNHAQGSAHVFVRRLEWEHYQELTAADGEVWDCLGASVAISGDTVVAVKSPGYAYPNPHPGGLYVFTSGACPNIEMDPVALPDAVAGSQYNQTITANGGAPSYQFSLSSGSLPLGLTLSQDGSLSGVLATEGVYSFTITATSPNFCPASRNYTMTVTPGCQAITIDPTLPAGAIGKPYSYTFTVKGGTAPYNFQISKGAPPGLKLSPEGKFSGVPTSAGVFKFSVTVSDANGCLGGGGYSLTIAGK
jgi:hypothetical protein